MADPIPVLIKDVEHRTPDGTEIINGQRPADAVAYAFTLNEVFEGRVHLAANTDPATSNNAAAGYGLYHWWINEGTGAVWLKVGETSGSAEWILVGSSGSAGPATQLLETGGPTILTVGDVDDGQYLRRAGSTVVGSYNVGTQVEIVLADKLLTPADAGKVLLVDGDVQIALPAVTASMYVTIVNIGLDTVNVVADPNDENVLLLPSEMSLPPAGSTVFSRLEAYSAGGNWYVVPLGTYTEVLMLAVSDEVTPLATGLSQVSFRMPYPFLLTEVRASLNQAPSGSPVLVDINANGSSVLSTKLSIDAGETTSTTAATAPVILEAAMADDALITVDVDQVGSTGPGAGLKVALYGYRM